MSGYDLKKYFDESVRHFWPATGSQIYRSLGRMVGEGWVRMQLVEQADRPDCKVYHLTDDGQVELHRWLTTPLDLPATRYQWLIQFFFAHQLSDKGILALFEAHAAKLCQRLSAFQRDVPPVIGQRTAEVQSARAGRLLQFTHEFGIAQHQWQLEWIEDAIRALQDLPAEPRKETQNKDTGI